MPSWVDKILPFCPMCRLAGDTDPTWK